MFMHRDQFPDELMARLRPLAEYDTFGNERAFDRQMDSLSGDDSQPISAQLSADEPEARSAFYPGPAV